MPPTPDASFDDAPGWDSSADSGPDAPAFDAGVDAPMLDAAFDAGPPCVCEERACSVGHCEGSSCVYAPLPRGTACGESAVCAEGACFVRFGCGDGFRETDGDAREGCDDGNEVDGDGCDSCVPTAFELDAVSPVSVASDPWGASLFVWVEHHDTGWIVWARRHRRVDGFEDGFVLAEGSGFDPAPSLVALRTGWVVAHHVSDEDLGDVAFTVLDHDTVVTRRMQRLPGRQRQTILFAVDRGFGAVWNDEEEARVVTREFDERAQPRGEPVVVGAGASPAADAGLIVWTHEGSVLARRVPDAAVELGAGFSPSVTRDAEGWVVAWSTRARDPRGDVELVESADGEASEPMMVAASEEAELRPVLSALGETTLLLFERGTPITGTVRDVGAAAWNAAPELDALAAELAAPDLQSTPALARASDALWVTWMDDELGARAFRLPVDGLGEMR